jgi:hypothetical protein
MKIWKYKIMYEVNEFIAFLPVGAKILHVDVQQNKPYFWALVDENQDLLERTFCVYDTGQHIDLPVEKLTYIGTFTLNDGDYVGHLFWILK